MFRGVAGRGDQAPEWMAVRAVEARAARGTAGTARQGRLDCVIRMPCEAAARVDQADHGRQAAQGLALQPDQCSLVRFSALIAPLQ